MAIEINEGFCKKICASLMNGKFICYYDKTNEECYRKVNMAENFSEIQRRLDDVGFTLMHSERNKTFYVVSHEDFKHRKYKMNKLESIVLLFLIQRYFNEIKNINTDNIVYVKWNDFLHDIEETFQSNAEKRKIIDALWILKNSGVIDINVTKKELMIEDTEEHYNITIYPSVNCILQYEKLQDIEDKLDEYMTKKDDINDDNIEKGEE